MKTYKFPGLLASCSPAAACSNRQVFALMKLVAALVAQQPAYAQPATPIAEDVIHYWLTNADSFSSLQYEIALSETAVQLDSHPFSEHEAALDRDKVESLKGQLVFSIEGNKVCRALSGHRWDAASQRAVHQECTTCFDGTSETSLISSGALSMGFIHDKNSPGSEITNGTDLIPIWLTYSPLAILAKLGFLTDDMSVRQSSVMLDGEECIVLELPRKGVGWSGEIHVGKDALHLPVRFAYYLRGVMKQEIVIKYDATSYEQPVMSSYKQVLFDKSGKATRSIVGHTRGVIVNEDLPMDVFKVEFPMGTHVRYTDKRGVNRYYRQLEGGAIQPIMEDEYATPPPIGLSMLLNSFDP